VMYLPVNRWSPVVSFELCLEAPKAERAASWAGPGWASGVWAGGKRGRVGLLRKNMNFPFSEKSE
jgi:hypothetical protein